jgi:hypothetical protein
LNIDKATKIIADGPTVKGNHVLLMILKKEDFNFIPMQCVKQQEDLLKPPTNKIIDHSEKNY